MFYEDGIACICMKKKTLKYRLMMEMSVSHVSVRVSFHSVYVCMEPRLNNEVVRTTETQFDIISKKFAGGRILLVNSLL